jgi:O-antigen/teichoic acid export membrane protein
MDWSGLYLATTLSGCVVNLALNFLLIPHYGCLGTAISAVASTFVAGVGACFLLPRLFTVGRMLVRALLLPVRWIRWSSSAGR